MSVLHKRYYYLLLSFLFFITVQAQMTLSFNCGRVDVPQFEDNSHAIPQSDYTVWNVLTPIQKSKADVEMRVIADAGTFYGPMKTIYAIKLYKDTTVIEQTNYYDDLPGASELKGFQLTYSTKNIGVFKQTERENSSIDPCLFTNELVRSNLLSFPQDIKVTDDTLRKLGIVLPTENPKAHPRYFFESYKIEVKINDQYRLYSLEMDGRYSLAAHTQPYDLLNLFLTKYFKNFKL